MTVVKYNNCEFIGQNTPEYRSTLSGVGGWVGGFELVGGWVGGWVGE